MGYARKTARTYSIILMLKQAAVLSKLEMTSEQQRCLNLGLLRDPSVRGVDKYIVPLRLMM